MAEHPHTVAASSRAGEAWGEARTATLAWLGTARAQAAAHEKAELDEEREGLETTRAGVEARSAAAQAVLKEGGHNALLLQVMDMVQRMSASLEEVKKEVKSASVTLGSLAMDELDCPRLVFITPYTPPEKRTIKTRVTEKITKAVKDRHRLIFLDPVTGTAVPCGSDGQAPWPSP